MKEVLNSSETAQKTPFFIVTAVKTSNLTNVDKVALVPNLLSSTPRRRVGGVELWLHRS
jgi:hypothetical protein